MNEICFIKKDIHRCLGLISVLTTFVICSIIVYGSLKYNGYGSERNSIMPERLADEGCISTCFTKDCVLHANLLNKNIDPSVDKCEDFYSFSCGSFQNQVAQDESYSRYDFFNNRIYMEIKAIMDNLEADPESASGKMKIVYDSCMDTRSLELDAVSSLLDFIGVPNWPNLPPNFNFTKPLSTVLGTLLAYKESALFGIYIRDFEGEPPYNISVYSDVSKDPSKAAEILKYFDLDEKKDLESVFNYLDPLLTLKRKLSVCDNSTNFHLNCSQDVAQQWKVLCEIVGTFVDVSDTSHLTSTDSIIISCHDVEMVESLLNLTTKVPHKILADLFVLNLFTNHVDDLNSYFRLIKNGSFGDEKPKVDRQELCREWLIENMVFALGREYIIEILTKQVLFQVQDVVEECYREIKDLINSQTWLVEKDKTQLLYVLDKPVTTELMLKYHLNETFVNNLYSKFHPKPGSFIKNVLERQRAFYAIDEPLLKNFPFLRGDNPFMVNAYYWKYAIGIAFGYMRFPAFILDQPRLLNLIRILVSFGHELGHGIDLTLDFADLKYEKLNSTARLHFKSRSHCIYNQYSNYTIESLGLKVKAKETKYENHADAIAVTLIDKLIKKYGVDEFTYSLPSLPYSTKQLIYLIYTEITCEKSTKEVDKLMYVIDPHPQERFRITAVMQNSDSFATAFNCTEGSYMNPKTKCSLMDIK